MLDIEHFCFCIYRMVFGYAYPAYECFKTVEKNKPEIEQLRFWCQYWYLSSSPHFCSRNCAKYNHNFDEVFALNAAGF